MKTLKTVFTLLMLLYGFAGNAQMKMHDKKMPYRSRCKNTTVETDTISSKAVYPGGIRKYFFREISFRDFNDVYGVVIVDIRIDTNGTVCALNLYNYTINTDDEIFNLNVAAAVNAMGKWQPADKNGISKISCRRLAFYSHIKGHPVFDMGFIEDNTSKQWEIVGSPAKSVMSFDWDEMNNINSVNSK